jgi:hypothetical protein
MFSEQIPLNAMQGNQPRFSALAKRNYSMPNPVGAAPASPSTS